MNLPTDTILDTDPKPLPVGSGEFLKAVYLAFGKLLELPDNWSEKQTIDALEKLRRRDLVRIVETKDGSLELRITPTGAAASWLRKHGVE